MKARVLFRCINFTQLLSAFLSLDSATCVLKVVTLYLLFRIFEMHQTDNYDTLVCTSLSRFLTEVVWLKASILFVKAENFITVTTLSVSSLPWNL